MAKLPNAPDLERLRELDPSLKTLEAGTELHRIYRRGGDHPTRWNALRFFGPTGSRFDHHLRDADGHAFEQDRGILYLSGDIPTALAEVYQVDRTVDRGEDRPWLVSFELAADVKLLDLTDTFAALAGGSMKIVCGPRVYSQNWSRGFYECYREAQGIFYPSSLTNRPVIALSERALPAKSFPTTPTFHRALSDALLIEPLRNACREIGYRLV